MRLLWTLVKVLLGAGLIAALFLLGGLDLAVLATAASRWGYLIAGILCLAPIITLGAVRWHAILGEQGIRPPFVDVLRLNYIGMFFNLCLPGLISGDMVKAYYVVRDHTEKKIAEAAATVLVDRVIGAVTLLSIAMVALALNAKRFLTDARLRPLGAGIAVLFVVGWAFIFVMLSRRLRVRRRKWLGRRGKLAGFFVRLDDAVAVYRDRRAAAWLGMGLSVVAHLLNILACYFFGRAVGDDILPFTEYLYLIPIGLAGNFLPLTPMGLGIGESCFEGLFRLRGSGLGAEIQILWRIGMAAMGLVGLFFYVARRRELAEAMRAGRSK